jgi:hypothetical protein
MLTCESNQTEQESAPGQLRPSHVQVGTCLKESQTVPSPQKALHLTEILTHQQLLGTIPGCQNPKRLTSTWRGPTLMIFLHPYLPPIPPKCAAQGGEKAIYLAPSQGLSRCLGFSLDSSTISTEPRVCSISGCRPCQFASVQ